MASSIGYNFVDRVSLLFIKRTLTFVRIQHLINQHSPDYLLNMTNVEYNVIHSSRIRCFFGCCFCCFFNQKLLILFSTRTYVVGTH